MLEFLPLSKSKSFPEVFVLLEKMGKSIFIRRDIWPENTAVGIKRKTSFNSPILFIKSKDKTMPWLPDHEDLFAHDWLIVKEHK